MLRILSKAKKGLKVCHINAQSLNKKIDEFRYLFENSGVDVICVSETWFRPEISDATYRMNDFKLYRSDRISHAGGVAIYIRKNIKCKMVSRSASNDAIEFLLLELSNGVEKLLLGNVYRPHRDIDIAPLITMLSTITLNYDNVLLSGDFNSDLISESILSDEMQSLGMFPANNDIPTHFTSTASTLLDLFFINNTSKILLYDQLSAPVFSRHDLLFATYDFEIHVENYGATYSYRDFKRINYDDLNFRASMIPWDLIYLFLTVDEKLDYLQSNIQGLYNDVVPLRTRRIDCHNKPWFSSNIKRLIELRNNAYNKWKRFKLASFHALYRELRNRVTLEIRHAKTTYYENKFSSSINSKSKWKVIRSIGLTGKDVPSDCVTDVDEMNKHFLDIPLPPGNLNFYSSYDTLPQQHQLEFTCFTNEDVLRAIIGIKSNSTGFDELHPTFVKILLPVVLSYITHIFNSIVTTSTFPNSWKYAKVLPIPKTGGDFRPIAILPFLSKVFERLIYGQINEFVVNSNLLTDMQSGFRPKLSCVSTLIKVSEDIRSRLDENNMVFLVLLDHTKAFDAVDHMVLLMKLEKFFHFSPSSIRLLASYLQGRCQSVFSNGRTSNNMLVSRGVPQGSILGPLLYTLYSNDLPERLQFCNIHMYADDVQLYHACNAKEIDQCIRKINMDLCNVHEWATANGLCINPRKSKCILIHKRSQSTSFNGVIRLGNSNIEMVDSAKNLGIIFDRHLTWSNHVIMTSGRVYGMLRSLWCSQWFTPFSIRMLLAKTYLVPTLLYGCELFAFCGSDERRRLNVTFNSITRYIYGLGRRDSVSVFSKQLFGVSFDSLLKCRALIYLHKIIYTCCPSYLYDKLTFMRSNRGNKIVQIRHRTHLSDYQFFINVIRIWNQLPLQLQTTSNASQFKTLLFNHYKN